MPAAAGPERAGAGAGERASEGGREPAIVCERISKRYGAAVALDEVSFAVGVGEVVGFVGPNGAGKSTALRILTGYLAPDGGAATIAGHDVVRARRAAQACVGYLPETAPLYRDMRVREYLRFRARLGAVAPAQVAARVAEVIERAGLEDRQRQLIATLSRGYRQRVGLAGALVSRPAVLILDEPTAGLDPVQTRAFRALLAARDAHQSVLVSSHDLADIEAVADRVVVLARGRVVGDDTPAGLRAGLGLAADCAFETVFLALLDHDEAGERGGQGDAGKHGALSEADEAGKLGEQSEAGDGRAGAP
ncbi:MAG: hypothetical protein Tsb0020_06200 [Haliangiales bacterium]